MWFLIKCDERFCDQKFVVKDGGRRVMKSLFWFIDSLADEMYYTLSSHHVKMYKFCVNGVNDFSSSGDFI